MAKCAKSRSFVIGGERARGANRDALEGYAHRLRTSTCHLSLACDDAQGVGAG